MAIWTAIYTYADAKGETATTEINFPEATSFEGAREMARRMATLMEQLVTGALQRITINYAVDLPGGLRATPQSASDVEEGGKFQFRTVNGFPTGLRLPTFDETKINPGSRDINTADTDVAAFVTAMRTGITLTSPAETVRPTDKRNEDISTLVFAREQFLSSRR